MALLQEMFYLYNENTTGTLVGVLVVTVIVYFFFFGKSKQPVPLKETKSRDIKSVDINATKKKPVVKLAKKEAVNELETKQVLNADKGSEASVDVTVKKEPVLAVYDATSAMCLLESRQYIKSHFKISSKSSTSSNVLIGSAAVALATAATTAGHATKSEHTTIEGLECGNGPNEFVKQDEETIEKKNETKIAKKGAPLVKEKEITFEPKIEPTNVETNKAKAAQTEKKEPAIELVVEKKNVVAAPIIEEMGRVSEHATKEIKYVAASTTEGKKSVVKETEKNLVDDVPKSEVDESAVLTEEIKKEIVDPFIAAYNATEAITTLEAQQYISDLPKAPKPFLAAYNATDAITTLEAQQYVYNLPKAPKPFLAAYNATDAITTLEAQQYVSNLPKAPKPFLAAYNATDAITTLEAQHYVSNLPKASKPFLAAYNATDAITTLEAQHYISNLPKAPKPFLAAYDASTAQATLKAQEYTASRYKSDTAYNEALKSTLDRLQSQEKTGVSRSSSGDSLALSESTSTSNVPAPREHVEATYKEHLSALKTATSAIQSVANETLLTEKSDEEENNGLSLSPSDASSSTSSLRSGAMAETTTKNAKTSRDINTDSNKDHDKALHINTIDQNNTKSAPHFDLSWDQIYTGGDNNSKKSPTKVQLSPTSIQALPVTKTNGPFMSTVQCTYYPNCTNKNCKFIHPGNDNNPRPIPKRASTVDTEYKKPWTRPERIERQSQTHYPTWKSRCVHWPYCTNNHCKYSHPIKECRMGDQCTFMERCMFLHPADFMEPVRKGASRNNNNSNNTHVKRSNTTFN